MTATILCGVRTVKRSVFWRPNGEGLLRAQVHERVCRFRPRGGTGQARIGAVHDDTVVDLSAAGVGSLGEVLDAVDPAAVVRAARTAGGERFALADVALLAPVERQEVWAAGVTYLRSKAARMQESDFSATAYDRVYDAPRPELFFKAVAEKVVGPGDGLGIRADARWNVPEPELALVMNARGELVGCTIGNDMSSRDIEGENLLYLPHAKIYDRGCGLGPWIDRIKRSFDELAGYLWRSQSFPHGVVLLTGTGVVPDDSFTLAAGDQITIHVDGIGTLENGVLIVA
jgi:2-dehydro-3-deoxy-D-arabinonate dehydratase